MLQDVLLVDVLAKRYKEVLAKGIVNGQAPIGRFSELSSNLLDGFHQELRGEPEVREEPQAVAHRSEKEEAVSDVG